MFGTIRKHQKWLWIVIIGITILGMVVWQSQTGNGNQRGGSGNFGSIDNKAITGTEWERAKNDVYLMYYVRTHQWPDNASEFDVTSALYQRLMLTRRMDEYNIHADPEAAAQFARVLLGQWEQGQPISNEKFLAELKRKNLTAEDFEHFLEGDIAIRQLEEVVGTSGKVVTPDEIQSLYVQQYQELAVDAVFFSASNYLAKIPAPTPDALGQFYTNQQATYREPDKMQLRYVFFNVTNFMPAAEQQFGTNLNRTVDEAMARFGTNISQLGKTVEEARGKVRELLLQQVAQSNAIVQAKALATELKGKTNALATLEALAKERKLEVKTTKPFDKEFGPGEMNLGPNVSGATFFELTPEDPLMEPVRGTDGVYVLVYDKVIPSHIPALSEIRDRVEEDYKLSLALRRAQLDGQSFAQTATNEMAHGKTFAQTCETTRVTLVPVPPFSLGTTRLPEVEERGDLNTFKTTAFGTPVGKVSTFTQTADGGFVVHVKQRLPLDEAKMKTQLPEFSNLVRQRRQSEAFNIWFGTAWNQELNRGLREVAALHKQQ
jgi:hypothetical protein